MTAFYDHQAIVASLAQARAGLDEAQRFGRSIAPDIDRIYFIACGSANRAMLGLQWWIEHYSGRLEVRRFFPAEFMACNPAKLDARTLVVLASKSGTTPETVAAADFLKDASCKIVAFSQFAEKPLAQKVPRTFLVGETPESFTAMAMLMHAMIGGILAEEGWPLLDKLMQSLHALPVALTQAALQNDGRAKADAEAYATDRVFYHVASGPGFTTAYVFGVCILMEMLWLHSYPIEAAEFFHGPFEIVDKQTPLILLLGEDPTRPLMERVKRFCDTYAGRVMQYDSKEYAMPGIAPEIRPILAPYILQAALKRFSVHLSEQHGQPLSTRRYMWKVPY